MIEIIYGEDTKSSREYLNSQNLTSLLKFDATNTDLSELTQILKGSSLFSSEQSILIENLFSKKAKNFEEIVALINDSDSDIYIYEGRSLSAKQVSSFKKAKLSEFKFPQTLFAFLDSIYPNNPRSLDLFHTALKTTELEILLFMIIRQLRVLIAIQTNSEIEEAKRLASWQKGKLIRQASLFGEKKLIKAYKNIFDIDLRSKSGGLSLPLTGSIDMWLLNL